MVIFTSLHFYIFTFLHFHIFTFSHFYIFTYLHWNVKFDFGVFMSCVCDKLNYVNVFLNENWKILKFTCSNTFSGNLILFYFTLLPFKFRINTLNRFFISCMKIMFNLYEIVFYCSILVDYNVKYRPNMILLWVLKNREWINTMNRFFINHMKKKLFEF